MSLSTGRMVVGCMTGTSLDALDAALVQITGSGLAIRARLVRLVERPLSDLAFDLRRLAEQQPMTAGEIGRLALRFGELHADVVEELLAGAHPDLVALHGQTVFHAPPTSWQLINAWPIVHRLRAPVVHDLRGADLAAGGQGAPITPLADWVLFRADRERAVINLGGYCNITLLPPDPGEAASESSKKRMTDTPAKIQGFDLCACNHVLDGVARAVLNAPFDSDGAAAATGAAHAPTSIALRRVLTSQHAAARSLGTGDEASGWIHTHRELLSPSDLAASAVDALARTIADAVRGRGEAIVAGGGARNLALLARLAHHLGEPVRTTESLGVPIHAREAVAIAVLGALAQDRVPITLPQVTQRHDPAPIAGAWLHPS